MCSLCEQLSGSSDSLFVYDSRSVSGSSNVSEFTEVMATDTQSKNHLSLYSFTVIMCAVHASGS